MRVVVGDEVGLLKAVTFTQPPPVSNGKRRKPDSSPETALAALQVQVKPLINSLNRDYAIVHCRFASANKSKIIAATKNGRIVIIDADSGIVDSEMQVFDPPSAKNPTPSVGNKVSSEEHFIGLFESAGTIISCTSRGRITYHQRVPSLYSAESELSDDALPEISSWLNLDNLAIMRVFDLNPKFFATGGCERDVALWRTNRPTNSESTDKWTISCVWKAKNVANTYLDLRVPIHVTDIQFFPEQVQKKSLEKINKNNEILPSRIATVSLHKHYRIYNVGEGKRKPTLSVEIGEMPAKRLFFNKRARFAESFFFVVLYLTGSSREAVITDTKGSATIIDTETGKRIGIFKGFHGTISDAAFSAAKGGDAEDSSIFVSVGTDRHLRIHQCTGKRLLMHKVGFVSCVFCFFSFTDG
ncbi:WD repeat-containing protein 74 [Entophlyctis luteolus]|nr:WD repeat-containing protein 74 [Entophlyctis luteolus]